MPKMSLSVINVFRPIGVGCERERYFLRVTFPWLEGRTPSARVCKRAPCRTMRRAATGCDGMSFNQILSRCRELSGRAALCRGMSRLAGAAGDGEGKPALRAVRVSYGVDAK